MEKEFTSMSLVLLNYISLKGISLECQLGLTLNMFNMSYLC